MNVKIGFLADFLLSHILHQTPLIILFSFSCHSSKILRFLFNSSSRPSIEALIIALLTMQALEVAFALATASPMSWLRSSPGHLLVLPTTLNRKAGFSLW